MKGNTDLYVGQIDAVYPLSEVWKLQAGVKTSFVTIDNTAGICVRRLPAGCRTGALGSRFVYDENINASYLQAGYEKDRLKISAGLRLEHTHVHGDFGGNTQQKDSSFTTNYFHLFPTMLCNTV